MPGTSNSGRRRKPTIIHELNGNPSRLNLQKERGEEPQFSLPNEVPKPPKALKPPRKPKSTGDIEKDTENTQIYKYACVRARYAVKEWKRLAPELHRLGLLTEASLQYFVTYCRAVGMMLYCAEMADTIFDLSISENKKMSQNAYLRMEKEARETMRWAGTELGLSPASCSKVKTNPPQKKTSAASFMDRAKSLHAVK